MFALTGVKTDVTSDSPVQICCMGGGRTCSPSSTCASLAQAWTPHLSHTCRPARCVVYPVITPLLATLRRAHLCCSSSVHTCAAAHQCTTRVILDTPVTTLVAFTTIVFQVF